MTGSKTDKARYGFERDAVSLANWRKRPYSKFAFSHVSDFIESATAKPSPHASALCCAIDPEYLSQSLLINGAQLPLQRYLEYSETDILLVWQSGKMVGRYVAPHADGSRPHIVFSITKSVTGLLAGILEDAGALQVEKSVQHYLPEAAGSGFGDCTIRDLLDMRVSLAFEEIYDNADGDYARYRRAMAWNPPEPEQPEEDLRSFLLSLRKGPSDHGGAFRYLSPVSDMLGLVLEQACGMQLMAFFERELWQPLKAQYPASLTLDRAGNPRAAGGMSMAAEDLLRIGLMLMHGGSVDGRQCISERWIADMRSAGDDASWQDGEFFDFVVGGRYRNQWYQMPRGSDAFFATGIHGQWLYVDRHCETVIVKLASQDAAQDDALDQMNLACFAQLANRCS